MTKTVQIKLPDLPKRYIWIDETAKAEDHYLIKFSIYKKWGWFHKLAVAGDTFMLPSTGDPVQLAETVSMQAELLVMQLPFKIELPTHE
jgi:hypothetical protein